MKRATDNDGYAKKSGKPSLAERLGAVKSQSSEVPDWGRIDGDTIRSFVERATRDDGAVMLGYTRDGGAYSVKVYAGGDPIKYFVHSDAELYEVMQDVIRTIDEG